MHRDLVDDNLPHLDRITLKAISTKDAAEAQNLKESATVSDKLTDELLVSDLLIIATPTWSFGIPSSLKAWVDLVVRPAKTFSYTNHGVWGLAKGKRRFWYWPQVACSPKAGGNHGTLCSLICAKS
jgi:FMN-dependent NADH-azoreductase